MVDLSPARCAVLGVFVLFSSGCGLIDSTDGLDDSGQSNNGSNDGGEQTDDFFDETSTDFTPVSDLFAVDSDIAFRAVGTPGSQTIHWTFEEVDHSGYSAIQVNSSATSSVPAFELVMAVDKDGNLRVLQDDGLAVDFGNYNSPDSGEPYLFLKPDIEAGDEWITARWSNFRHRVVVEADDECPHDSSSGCLAVTRYRYRVDETGEKTGEESWRGEETYKPGLGIVSFSWGTGDGGGPGRRIVD